MSTPPITSVFNDGYLAEQYERFQRDPSSVEESFRQLFRFAASLAPGAGAGVPTDGAFLRSVAGAASYVGAIQRYGHLAAQLDPLGSTPLGAAELRPEFHGVTEEELRRIPATALPESEIFLPASANPRATAADVVQRVRDLYCGSIGYDIEHLEDENERAWFRSTIAAGTMTTPLTADERKAVLRRLTEVDGLERFLGLAFVNAKRFSIEGLDAMVPMLDEVIACGARTGARSVVIGMAHRGRLNVLVHTMGKPYATLFAEFLGRHADTNAESETGDVKYHLGYLSTREVQGAGTVELELAPNPSHLEFVNPVVSGMARAKQRRAGDQGRRDEACVLPVLIHGDAAFPGEGIVSETLNLSLLRGYRVGGTLHVIANNQVGFTTDPQDGRSTYYSSDLAKGFEIPVVHVNGDDPEACLHAVRMAIAYRERFRKDFLIDVVGYRRHGHNEADQPSFTQPKLYEVIKGHPSPREVWGARLVRERVVTEQEVESLDRELADRLGKILAETKQEDEDDHGADASQDAPPPPAVDTALPAECLVSLNEQLLQWPSTFTLHPTLKRTLPRRREAIHAETGAIDWGHAEALAFASLLVDGTNVRLTGQDAERGTFSHRQAVLHDVKTGEAYTPLANLPDARGVFELYNSPLSETAVMGFEYGFSTAAPNDLVLWEAQFGDFANVAQPIVDQFLAADRAKWGQDTGLVLLLPHGYEGQGPEHSSARLERFLQLCAEGNLIVANPSTPAQYFHLLRRQAMRGTKRPLVLMQPKSLLRLPAAASRLDELASGTFRPVIDDPTASRSAAARREVKRLVVCTGKLYYDLTEKERPASVAIARVEELYPWPQEIAGIVERYENVEEIVWAQEEPRNMGAWTYVQPRMRADLGTQIPLRYVGRPDRASPAEGYHSSHLAEQARIVAEALTPTPAPSGRRKAGAAKG